MLEMYIKDSTGDYKEIPVRIINFIDCKLFFYYYYYFNFFYKLVLNNLLKILFLYFFLNFNQASGS